MIANDTLFKARHRRSLASISGLDLSLAENGMARYLSSVLIAVLFLGTPARGWTQAVTTVRAGLTPAEAAAVDRAITDEMERDQLLGLALGILRDGEIVYLKGYDFADCARTKPVTDETLFRWASCSKLLGAIAAMQLVEQGKLDLDADVRTYVPEFPEKPHVVTTRQILCHQSGIPHYSNGEVVPTLRDYPSPHPFEDPVLALDKFNQSPLLYEPGTQMTYSSHAFVLLSAVVQRAGGAPFCDQVRRRITDPVGADTLRPHFHDLDETHWSEGQTKVDGVIIRSEVEPIDWKHAAGGYVSNIDDFARFARGIIRRQYVSEQTEAAMWTRQKLKGGEETYYGLGFRVDDENGRLKVSHGGAQSDVRTRLVCYPTERHGMVCLCNCTWGEPEKYTTLAYQALAEARATQPSP
jgi:CubicO group peptidase (beta-lactamase class C family)